MAERRGKGKRARVAEEGVTYTVGPNDNIFAALGRPDADELLAKAELAREIERLIKERGLTQTAAARILGVTQPDVSDLFRGRLGGFSMERLYRFLNALGRDVQIVVQPTPRARPAGIRALVKVTARAARTRR